MRKTSKIISFAAAAALLLSGCGTGTPAPAVSESETTTSAAETTTAEATASAVTTTTVTTTTAPEPEFPDTGIWQHHFADRLTLDIIHGDYSLEELVMKTAVGDSKAVSMFEFRFDRPENDYTVRSDGGDRRALTMEANDAGIAAIASTTSYSENVSEELLSTIAGRSRITSDKFPSAYEIKWSDPVAEAMCTHPFDGDEGTYKDPYELTYGYTIAEPVKVNALVCGSDEGLSVLIDPVYMYGLPLLSWDDVVFTFGGHEIVADSLLLTGEPTEGLALDTPDYAYAQVTLTDINVSFSFSGGYSNTCTVTDISIIDTFTDIADYALSENDTVIGNVEKDPVMSEIYGAVMDAKSDIFSESTHGIVLLDMDFDGKPEVLVTRIGDEEDPYRRTLDTEVYRVSDGVLKYIDTMRLCFQVVYYDGAVVGLSQLKDGTPAWFATTRTYHDDNVEGFYEEDYLYTLDGDKLNMHPLFTHRETDDQITVNGDTEKLDYYFYDEQIVPTITVEEVGPYNEPDWELLSWNGSSAWFGMWELFGFARAKFAGSITTSYSLYSDWLSSGFTGGYTSDKAARYKLTDREFAHHIAYMVDDWFINGTSTTEHKYWFLGDYAKPVIYLYPEEQTNVSVQVNFPLGGEFTCTYPEYGDGWNVTAMPDGTLYDKNGDEYYCLYWEGKGAADFDMSKGFCVAGTDTAKFLREKLMYIGLTAREANEFIIYWLPKMQDNPYNVITLHTDDYARSVPLTVSPAPDTQIRVFMTYYSSDTPVDIPEQKLPHYDRTGFTLVEWGGSEE